MKTLPVIEEETFHVLCPRKCRSTIRISSIVSWTSTLLKEILNKAYRENIIVIMDIKTTETEQKFVYDVVFIQMQPDLIPRLKTLGIHNVIFHVGKNEDIHTYNIFTQVPQNLATTNYRGDPTVASSPVQYI
jgi:hypothetical protein